MQTQTQDDRGQRPEFTTYLRLEELAEILVLARLTGSLAMFEEGAAAPRVHPRAVFARSVVVAIPERLGKVKEGTRAQLGGLLESTWTAAPEGRKAVAWGALGGLVKLARHMGALNTLGRPWEAICGQLYEEAEALGFNDGELARQLQRAQADLEARYKGEARVVVSP